MIAAPGTMDKAGATEALRMAAPGTMDAVVAIPDRLRAKECDPLRAAPGTIDVAAPITDRLGVGECDCPRRMDRYGARDGVRGRVEEVPLLASLRSPQPSPEVLPPTGLDIMKTPRFQRPIIDKEPIHFFL